MVAPGFASNLARRVGTALVVLPAILAVLLMGPAWLALAIVVAALGVGLMQRCLDESLEYAKTRRTMGKPIVEHQAIALARAPS